MLGVLHSSIGYRKYSGPTLGLGFSRAFENSGASGTSGLAGLGLAMAYQRGYTLVG